MPTFGKAKAVQCYVYLLGWLIFVSIGLYWYLNHKGSELSTLSQAGFGYIEDKDYEIVQVTDKSKRHSDSSNKQNAEDGIHDRRNIQTAFSTKRMQNDDDEKVHDVSSSYTYDMLDDEETELDASAPVRLCNSPATIKSIDENVQVPDFKLDSIIVILRHGDRGPLTHVGNRNVSHINCSTANAEVHSLFKFSTESLPKLPGYNQFIGPFYTFPKVPPSSQCNLGQLTQLGFEQLYFLGKMIRSTYKSTLFNPNNNINFNNNVNNNNNFATSSATKDQSESIPIKVVSYSTRYRRTFQSLLAFLYGLVGPKYLTQSTSIRESQSITFCFNDCTCRAVDRLKKSAMLKYKPERADKKAMMKLVDHLNSILHEDNFKKTGTALLDSLLLYLCHNTKLPCKGTNRKPSIKSCVMMKEVSRLIRFIETETEGLKKLNQNRKYYLLSSYGLMREIVNLALKMISAASTQNTAQQHSHGAQATFQQASSLLSSSIMGNNYYSSVKSAFSKTRVAVFSGHDTTLQIITGALGIFENHQDVHLPPYGSRFIFEFYRKTNVPPNSPRKHYFRAIYNGISVTNLISFCKDSLVKSNSNMVSEKGTYYNNHRGTKRSSRDTPAHFCPMENLVRFLHDHYFEAFGNATNFREACHFI